MEGIFASLDRLGWEKSRLRGLWKVDCESYMATLSHNVKKLVRRLGRGIDPRPSLVRRWDYLRIQEHHDRWGDGSNRTGAIFRLDELAGHLPQTDSTVDPLQFRRLSQHARPLTHCW